MPITRHLTSKRAERRAQYDSPQHRANRKLIASLIDAGNSLCCSRCGDPITHGQPWDLDHTDDRRGYIGPSHARCNRSAGAKNRGLAPT